MQKNENKSPKTLGQQSKLPDKVVKSAFLSLL